MDLLTLKRCQSIIEMLKKKRSSAMFVFPVDPVKLNIPTYFDIIKEPMDLKKIS